MHEKSKYDLVRTEGSLYKAWSVVRDNGLASSSRETREEIKAFSKNLTPNIRRIGSQLRTDRFVFGAAKGLLLKKKNKSDRPVVVAPIPSRIVQRAILDVIQDIPSIASELRAGYNFGGVEGQNFGVPSAIEKALGAAQRSAYYIRTDIKSFFTAVPRDIAVSLIAAKTDDQRFNALLKRATDTELADLAKFGEKAKLFPLMDEGVAQGSCLSPLLCNYLLGDFDRAMNARGIVCIRYVDDFILFGPSRASTFKALQAGLTILQKLGLAAYNPLSSNEDEKTKADHGPTSGEIHFLGCEIQQDRVRPSKFSRTKLLTEITRIFNSAISKMALPKLAATTESNYADAICSASNKIRGWGNTYSFCTDNQLMTNIDIELTKRFDRFNEQVKQRARGLSPLDRRRISGLFCLEDCNKDPETAGTRLLVANFIATQT